MVSILPLGHSQSDIRVKEEQSLIVKIWKHHQVYLRLVTYSDNLNILT